MKNKFNWAVALFIISFCLPVLEGFDYSSQVLMGWDIALESIILTSDGIFGEGNLQLFYYIIALLPNPMVAIVIFLKYTKKPASMTIWLLSMIAVFLSLFWALFFFSIIFDYFSFGYWTWLVAIIMIHYYGNDGTFKRPIKNA